MISKIAWKKLVLCLMIPLLVGGLSALLTRNSMEIFETLQKPPFAPPGWLFPVAWTVLYLLMGTASYLVLESGGDPEKIRQALKVYGIQLAVNFLWPLLFFSLQRYLLSFLWLLLLLVLIVITLLRFRSLSPVAGLLLVPYLLWVVFAGYLNLGIFLLNR